MLAQRFLRIFRSADDGAASFGLGQYLAHAVGEILLIVAGILLALYIDDWYGDRQQQIHFKNAMERLYNATRDDLGKFQAEFAAVQAQFSAVDQLLHEPDTVEDRILLPMLFFLDTPGAEWARGTRSAVESEAQRIQPSPDDLRQLGLVEQITDYLDAMRQTEYATTFSDGLTGELITPLLVEAGVAQSVQPFTQAHWDNYSYIDLTFHTAEEIETVKALLRDGRLGNPLRAMFDRKNIYLGVASRRTVMAESLMASIKKVFPDLRLFYDEISLIGTALSPQGAKMWDEMQSHRGDREFLRENLNDYINLWVAGDVMMSRDPDREQVWQVELELYEGEVKFRSRRTWDENWGGDSFPAGAALDHGANIQVEPGRYRVELDLNELRYQFIPID